MPCVGEAKEGVAEDVLLWSRLLRNPTLTSAGDSEEHTHYVTSSLRPADTVQTDCASLKLMIIFGCCLHR